MLRYLDCFFRHRRLLIGIVAVSLVIGVATVMIRPRAYEATARLWVDATVEGDHVNPYANPSEVGSETIIELVKSRSFCIRAATRTGLANDVMHRHGGGATGQELGDLVYQAVTGGATVLPAGPNVVAVAFRYPDPKLAAAVTTAIVDEFKQEVLGGQVEHAKAAASFYRSQVDGVQKELSSADAKVADYLAVHPDDIPPPVTGSDTSPLALDPLAPSTGSNMSSSAPTDVDLLQLRREAGEVRKRHDALVEKMDKAQLDVAVAQQSTPNGVRSLDKPLIPNHPVPRLNQLIAATIGGLVAGMLLSLLALLALTSLDTSLRYAREVEALVGLRLAGSVPYIESR